MKKRFEQSIAASDEAYAEFTSAANKAAVAGQTAAQRLREAADATDQAVAEILKAIS